MEQMLEWFPDCLLKFGDATSLWSLSVRYAVRKTTPRSIRQDTSTAMGSHSAAWCKNDERVDLPRACSLLNSPRIVNGRKDRRREKADTF